MSPEELQAMMGVSALASQAGQLHEVYTEQIKAGFSEEQSIYLVASILTGSPGPAPSGDESDPDK